MNREDRSEWFERLKNEEKKSQKNVEEILQNQRELVKKRSQRKRLKQACLGSVAMIGTAVLCVFLISSLAFGGQDSSEKSDKQRLKETINQTEDTPAETQLLQDWEVTATVSGENVSANASVFYGNTILSTAGGITVDISQVVIPEWIQENYLTVNSFSRPCIAMNSIQHIAIHYVGNAGTTASQNRSYFENLKDTQERQASSHFVVGLEGEIIQCIPLNEMSYCTNERNVDTISIEVCHPDESGRFTEATYQSVVRLTAWLCEKFSLPVDNVIRHYDVTGKICPKYYVEHPDAWDTLKADIQNYIIQNPDIN